VAVKILRHMKGEQPLESEKNALRLPPHPHVVGVYDVLRIPQDRALVILERMEKGNLLSLINDPDMSLSLGAVVDISAQVACALSFCHSHGLLHLDVKPQNILIHSTGSVKLCDFGNSKRIQDLKKESTFTKVILKQFPHF
jgi:serine/threonine protein kinase